MCNTHFFLHGVSPDGAWLACATVDPNSDDAHGGIQLVPAKGGSPRAVYLGSQPVDGPKWSPDGQTIWFSGELEAEISGHAQIFCMDTDGSGVRRMVHSPAVDWFPHPSPDGTMVSFIRYPAGTLGHPPDQSVEIWFRRQIDGELVRLAAFRGGQGSLNVNSWSPDSRLVSYVVYPLKSGVS